MTPSGASVPSAARSMARIPSLLPAQAVCSGIPLPSMSNCADEELIGTTLMPPPVRSRKTGRPSPGPGVGGGIGTTKGLAYQVRVSSDAAIALASPDFSVVVLSEFTTVSWGSDHGDPVTGSTL